ILAFHLVAPRYDIKVYRTNAGQRGPLLLTIRSEHATKGLKECLLVEDAEGRLLGRFTRSWVTRVFRIHWQCADGTGRVLFYGRQTGLKRILAYHAAW